MRFIRFIRFEFSFRITTIYTYPVSFKPPKEIYPFCLSLIASSVGKPYTTYKYRPLHRGQTDGSMCLCFKIAKSNIPNGFITVITHPPVVMNKQDNNNKIFALRVIFLRMDIHQYVALLLNLWVVILMNQ